MTDLLRKIAVRPIIKYPRDAQVGKTYLMTIDLQPEEEFEWQYDEEEYSIYCTVDSDLFSSKPVGEPTIVLHRFGGNYGEAKFLLTAEEENQGNIRVSLINAWGVLIKKIELESIQVKSKEEALSEAAEEDFAITSKFLTSSTVETVSNELDKNTSAESKFNSKVSKTFAVVLAATSVEYKAVRSHLRDLRELSVQGASYEQGTFISNGQSREVVISEIRSSKTRVATGINQSINYFQPDVLIFLGTASGVKDVKPGDVVAVTKAYDYKSSDLGDEFKPKLSIRQNSYRIYQQAREESQREGWLKRLTSSTKPLPRVLVAPIASGYRINASRKLGILNLLKSYYTDAVAIDIESYEILEASRMYAEVEILIVCGVAKLIDEPQTASTPIIRGLSNLVNDQKKANLSDFQEVAASHASAFAFEVLDEFHEKRHSKSVVSSREIANRFSQFILNIQPAEKDISEINRQANYLVEHLRNKVAENRRFKIEEVFPAGSYVRSTALRSLKNIGSDLDIFIYFTGEGATKKNFSELKSFVYEQISNIYPYKFQTSLATRRGSIRFELSSGLNIDLVPVIREKMSRVENGGWFPSGYGSQYTDSWELTSVTCHNQFINRRTAKSKEISEFITFNKLVQLVKWWNNHQRQLRQSSIFCELITAAAFDTYGVTSDWQSSLRQVFSFLLENQFLKPIVFDDYYDTQRLKFALDRVIVLDPANPENNLARKWTERTRLGYLERLQDAYDSMVEAQNYELDGDTENAVAMWCRVFGGAFRSLSK